MRKFLFLIFIFFFSAASAQDFKEAITQQFLEYNNLIKNKEIEKAMDYVNEDFFKIFPKEKMIEYTKAMFEADDMEFSFGNTEILAIGNLQNVGEKFYSKIRYVSDMQIKINDTDSTLIEDKELMKKMTQVAFETAFGEGNVRYDSVSGFYFIRATKNALASSDAKKEKWQFVVVEEKQKPMLKLFLPEEILKD